MTIARIPYVRFDGQMSSKRRQETITQFSVPLENDSNGDDALVMDSSNEFDEDDDYRTASGSNTTCRPSKGKGKASVNPKVMLLSLKAVCPFTLCSNSRPNPENREQSDSI